MPLRGTLRPGILLILLGVFIYVPAYFWINSRTLTPLDMPMTLSAGQFNSPDFKINLEGNFFVYATSDGSDYSACLYLDQLRTRSSVSTSGRTTALSGASTDPVTNLVDGSYLGYFHTTPGTYRLNVEIFSSTEQPNRCSPHIEVETSSYEYYEWERTLSSFFTFALFLGLLGVVILFVAFSTRAQSKSLEALKLKILPGDSPAISAPLIPENPSHAPPMRLILGLLATTFPFLALFAIAYWPVSEGFATALALFVSFLFPLGLSLLVAQRLAVKEKKIRQLHISQQLPHQGKLVWGITGLHFKRRSTSRTWHVNPVANLPAIALACCLTCMVAFLPVFLIQMNRRSTHGLLVSVLRKDAPAAARDSAPAAPLIFVDAKSRVFLNYKQTNWEALPAELDLGLMVLPVRVAYVDAAPEVQFSEVARAIDLIEGHNARAILLTPHTKSGH